MGLRPRSVGAASARCARRHRCRRGPRCGSAVHATEWPMTTRRASRPTASPRCSPAWSGSARPPTPARPRPRRDTRVLQGAGAGGSSDAARLGKRPAADGRRGCELVPVRCRCRCRAGACRCRWCRPLAAARSRRTHHRRVGRVDGDGLSRRLPLAVVPARRSTCRPSDRTRTRDRLVIVAPDGTTRWRSFPSRWVTVIVLPSTLADGAEDAARPPARHRSDRRHLPPRPRPVPPAVLPGPGWTDRPRLGLVRRRRLLQGGPSGGADEAKTTRAAMGWEADPDALGGPEVGHSRRRLIRAPDAGAAGADGGRVSLAFMSFVWRGWRLLWRGLRSDGGSGPVAG